MGLRILLSIAAISMALVGLGLIVAPQAIGMGAVLTDASDALMAYLRLFGSPFLGIAVLNWTARNAIILGNMVGFGAIAALDVWGLFSGARQLTNAAADKGVRDHSSAVRRGLHLGRAKEHVSQHT
jgi:hypothetical protein